MMSELYERIYKYVNSVKVLDTHEHLVQEFERVDSKIDVFRTLFSSYASSDLVSSGMPPEELDYICDPSKPLGERWEKLAPYWEKIQNTGYARALNIAIRDLYGLEGLTEKTYMELARRMQEANKSGLYNYVLREKSNIERAVLDTSLITPIKVVDQELFAPVIRFRDFIIVRSRLEIEELGRRTNTRIHELQDLVEALEKELTENLNMIVGVKIGLAYMRSLNFEKVTFSEAEEVFNNIYKERTFKRIAIDKKGKYLPSELSITETKPLQDYMVHKILQLASKYSLPVQIHTGLQEGNENIITNSNPTLLTNLFREYGEVKFDIFHGSYPYTGELAALAKNFPNVYVDMCWLHIISPHRARAALHEWLDTVPSNKILGFGGDYQFVEGVYGHLTIARENVAKVLTEKVEEGCFSEEYAKYLANRLLRENVRELFFSEKRA